MDEIGRFEGYESGTLPYVHPNMTPQRTVQFRPFGPINLGFRDRLLSETGHFILKDCQIEYLTLQFWLY